MVKRTTPTTNYMLVEGYVLPGQLGIRQEAKGLPQMVEKLNV